MNNPSVILSGAKNPSLDRLDELDKLYKLLKTYL